MRELGLCGRRTLERDCDRLTRGLKLMSKTLAFEARFFSHGLAAYRYVLALYENDGS